MKVVIFSGFFLCKFIIRLYISKKLLIVSVLFGGENHYCCCDQALCRSGWPGRLQEDHGVLTLQKHTTCLRYMPHASDTCHHASRYMPSCFRHMPPCFRYMPLCKTTDFCMLICTWHIAECSFLIYKFLSSIWII